LHQLLFDNSCTFFSNNKFNVYYVDLCTRQQYSLIKKWGSQGTGFGFSRPADLAIDSSGYLYVTDISSVSNKIQKFDSNGNFITKWGTTGSTNGQFLTPVAIATDSSDNVYVIDGSNNRVQKFDSNGNFITKWGTAGAGDGQFTTPAGIAVDSLGNVFVADQGNNRIQSLTATVAF
jgi:tripartite motif-containing protein 71